MSAWLFAHMRLGWLWLGQVPAPGPSPAQAEQPLGLPGQKGFPAKRCLLIIAYVYLNRMLGNSSIKLTTSGNTLSVQCASEGREPGIYICTYICIHIQSEVTQGEESLQRTHLGLQHPCLLGGYCDPTRVGCTLADSRTLA